MNKIIFIIVLFLAIFSACVQTDKPFNLGTNTDSIKVEIVNLAIEDVVLPFSDAKSYTLPIDLYLPNNQNLIIYSDIDTISFDLPLGQTVSLSVIKKGMKPVTINLKNGLNYEKIEFDNNSKNPDLSIIYENDNENPFLKELKSKYPIDSIASTEKTDQGKVRKIASWVHNLWKHDRMNEPEKNDALYILEEVKKGKRFRCVEYGIVTTACLNSIGIKARTLSLKTKDAETRPSGAGHVVLEVFLNDLDKWIIVDPQWDIIPHVNDIPLNAIEFQAAITNHDNIGIWTTEKITMEEYIPWIYPYLYYFSVQFDNRENISKEKRYYYNGKSDLMLVPLNAKNPTVFQNRFPIDYCFYTNSLQDFYGKP